MTLERCDICDDPTGNAGVLDDSMQCEICGRFICENCLSNDVPMDMSCGYTPTVCKLCALEQGCEEMLKVEVELCRQIDCGIM